MTPPGQLTPHNRSPLHLVGRFDQLFTGAERELPDLAAGLRNRRPVAMWSDVPPHPAYAAQGVRQIQPFAGAMPRGGTVLIGGVHVNLGQWLAHARPSRVVLRYNLPNHERLFDVIEQVRGMTGLEPELQFCSHALQLAVSLPGQVEVSLIDLGPFLAGPVARPARPFTIGRASRDVPEKHHADDPALYRMLAAQGFRVRILGGSCLAPQLQGVPGIELLPAGAEEVAAFYRTLDVFFYRTGQFAEPYGRVVFEAMASGLPVVASTVGGYAEFIAGSEAAVLVPPQSQEQAYDALCLLADDAPLRLRMGRAGRLRAIDLHGDAAVDEALGFYSA